MADAPLSSPAAELSPEDRELLAYLLEREGVSPAGADGIRPRPDPTLFPLSFAQERMWFLHTVDPRSPLYNIPAAVRLAGALDEEALRRALLAIVERHEVLRTRIEVLRGQPFAIPSPPDLEVACEDLRSRPGEEREAELARRVAEESLRPFDLTRGPLLRATLLRLGDRDHALLLCMHHIVSDGWSMSVLFRELEALYGAFAAGRPSPLPPLPIQYADFAHWQRERLQGETLAEQLVYWTRQLAHPPSVLELPADRPRPAAQTFRGAAVEGGFGPEVRAGLHRLAQGEGATLFMVLLAAFKVLLRRCSGQTDLLVGCPVANRTRAELEGLVGFFVNTLVLRTDLSGDPTFRELVGRVKAVALEAYAHQDLPFEKLVGALNPERALSHSPLFQVVFNLQNAPLRLHQEGLTVSALNTATGTAKFDLTLFVTDTPRDLRASIAYSTDLFDRGTVERLLGHYGRLLEGVVADPDCRISALPLLSEEERRQVLVEWNRTERELPRDATLAGLFEAQVERTPDAVAVVFEGESVSYRELNRRANRLAHRLRTLGVAPEVRVGVCTERSLEMVVALLGVLKAGGAYVALDPGYPEARLSFMLADAAVPVLLTQARLVASLPPLPARVVLLDAEEETAAGEADANPGIATSPQGLAYVIYTSGSTGQPKGAMNTHAGICNRLLDMQERHRLSPADRVLQKAPFSFDVSVWEFFWPLTTGARLVLARPEGHKDSAYLVRLIEEEGITAVHFVPSMLRAFLAEPGVPGLETLRLVFSGGEPLTRELQELFFSRSAAELHNLYGPAEAAVDVTSWACRCGDDRGLVPIGRSLANNRAYVLDDRLQPVPIGVVGELYLGGVQVGRGYLERPDLTAERFVPDPFGGVAGARLYRTGDLVRRLDDGSLEYRGRIDHQVKVRGFRIELGEIEAALEGHPQVRAAAVTVREDTPGDRRLVAYVAGEAGAPELRAYLQGKVPGYMVPAVFVRLDALPLNPSGKVDRRALPAPEGLVEAGEAYEGPRTRAEEVLARIWAEVLRVEAVGIRDNFFALGGDSILSLQVLARASDAGLRLSPKQIFQHQTVAELAAVAGTASAADAEQGPVTGPVALTPAQRRFLDSEPEEPHHFNQALLLDLRRPVAPEVLRSALGDLQGHHDALRTIFDRTASGWEARCVEPGEEVPFRRVDLGGIAEEEQARAIEAAATETQRSLDLERGPLWRVVLFERGEGRAPRLLVVIHHLVVDGVSWRVLLEDLQTACEQRAREHRVKLPPKTTSFKRWAERLSDHGRGGEAEAELEYWRGVGLPGAGRLPLDFAAGEERNTGASTRAVSTVLGEEETRALLQEVPPAYRTRIDEVLLTALVEALCRWTGRDEVVIDLEGHGREELFEGVDLSRTVGWFTAVYPARLRRVPGGAGEALKAVKEQLRSVPRRGIGYGVLRHLRGEPLRSGAEVVFNYLGQFDSWLGGSGLFAPAPGGTGPSRSERARRAHRLEVNGLVSGGRLRLTWSYSEALHVRDTIAALARGFESSLRALIAHCRGGAWGLTPSDFPLARLDQAALDRVVRGGRDVEDVYPLSPMQEGMLYHTRHSPESGLYFQQGRFELEGTLDPAALRRAWERVLERHGALRTRFCLEGLPLPVQVVERGVSLPWAEEDWSGLLPRESEDRFKERLEADRRRGFDLDCAPLMRMTLVRLGEARHRLVWSFHHALFDGWCLPLLWREVLLLYRSHARGAPAALDDPRPYREYVAWLGRQDLGAAERYWRSELAGFRSPTPLPAGGGRRRPAPDEGEVGESSLTLDEDVTAALKGLGRRHGLTLGTLVQGAWAILLSRHSGERDVLFGVTVSGRPAALPGVEGMVGLFINTLPLRVHVGGDLPVLEWLRDLQARQAEQRQWEYSPLAQVQKWSDVEAGSGLFQTLLVHENYPVDPALRELALEPRVRSLGMREATNYPLTVAVSSGSRLVIRLLYDVSRFDRASVEPLGGHLARLLERLAGGARGRVDELSLLGEGERRRVLVEWNATGREFERVEAVHRQFESQAARTPEALAVSCGDRRWSYGELDRRSSRLARELVGRGVGLESRVALCLERGPELVAAVLGVLKAGGAYVALDPEAPGERLRWMVEDSASRVVLTQGCLLGKLEGVGASVLCLDGEWEWEGGEEGERVSAEVSGEALAYVIYTSGSTGVPKGVELTHGGLRNLVEWHCERYGVGSEDRATQLAGLGFDASVWEVWPYLTRGASLHIPDEGTRVTPLRLKEWLVEEGITLSFLPTPLAEAVLGEEWASSGSLRALLTGGDRLRRRPGRGLGFEVVNHYGPTENTVVGTAGAVAVDGEEGRAPSIGKPISNVRAYVLDGGMEPVPEGVWGELYLGGAGLARGYVGRAELTAERFVPDPHGGEAGGRLYRTGDVVRYLPGGELEFLGRADQQVKVRGHRIELGEIETVLGRHPSVREAVVVAREDEAGDKRLVAYVVWRGEADWVSVREALREKLPESMVPPVCVSLEQLPLTASGKVDRAALPGPEEAGAGAGPVSPRTAVEEILAGIFAEVLGLETVGIHDDFFELGGHSLLATQVVSRVREALGVELALRQLFETPTVAGLAGRLASVPQSDTAAAAPPLAPVGRDTPPPLSFGQQRLWLLQELEPQSVLYNVAAALRLCGRLDVPVLEASLASLVKRHEALRTRFGRIEGRPVQVIDDGTAWRLAHEDLSALPEAEREGEARRRSSEEARRPFDLSGGPLFRAQLLRLDERDHVLALAMHHAVSDGWSVGVLVRELRELYAAFAEGRPSPLPELPVQYADFAAWQREWLRAEVLDEQLAYWKGRLGGAPPVLELPTDHPRPAVQRHRGARRERTLPAELRGALLHLSRREGATLFMVLLAALEALLWRYGGQTDLVVGSPIANRTRREVEGLVGFFVNTLALRTDVSGDPTFCELVRRVREVALGAYQHQDLPFEKLVEELRPERSLSHHPLFQVMFVLQNAPRETLQLPGLSLSPQRMEEATTAKFDLLLSVVEGAAGLGVGLGYDADLFEPSTIDRMLGHYEALLRAAVRDPGARLSELSLLAAGERRRVLREWNATSVAFPERSIGEVFEEAARARPEAVAVVHGSERLSYGELEARSNQLARYLRTRGVGVESRVGICLERSMELVVGLLGIVKAGGAYVPLDPEYPRDRLELLARDAGISVILTQERLRGRLSGCGAELVSLDEEWGRIGEEGTEAIRSEVGPEHLAYVTYTSGSTGVPKGVEVRHRGVLRLLFGADYAEFGPGEAFLQLAPVSFDASTLEIWGPLLHGGRCVLFPGRVPTPGQLGEVLRREGVTTLWLTASLYNAVVDEAPEVLEGLKQLLIGGEALSVPHVKKGLERLPGTRIINGYGPTEGTTFTCCYPIPREIGDVRSIPIGRPIGNTRVYVLDERMEPLPVGVAGELFIGGDGLARGYLRRPELTAETFVPDPFGPGPGGRLYRTGDRARYLEDGRVEYLGRLDDQVKVRGYRIEPGEIEAALLGQGQVRQCAVVVREDAPGDKRLVGYVVWQEGEAGRVAEVRGYLRTKLPEHMVPGALVALAELPLTPNGKVDRRALPAPEGRLERAAAYVAPASEWERAVAAVWREVLGTETVGLDDNFFELGGHSLLLVEVHRRLTTLFPEGALEVVELFEHPTVRSLAARLGRAGGRTASLPTPPPASRDEGRRRLARRRERRARASGEDDV